MYWGAGRESVTQGPEGVWGNQGVLGELLGMLQAIMGTSGGVGGVLGGWQGVQVLRGQKGYRWHKGAFGGS